MRFRTWQNTGFVGLILLTTLLLNQPSVTLRTAYNILFATIIILQLILLLIEDKLTKTHTYITVLLFLSISYLILSLLGKATITTFFLSGTLIITYLVTIALVTIDGWKKYHIFDKMIDALSERENKKKTQKKTHKTSRAKKPTQTRKKPVKQFSLYDIPATNLETTSKEIQEPPRVALKQSADGEWIEIKVRKDKL